MGKFGQMATSALGVAGDFFGDLSQQFGGRNIKPNIIGMANLENDEAIAEQANARVEKQRNARITQKTMLTGGGNNGSEIT